MSSPSTALATCMTWVGAIDRRPRARARRLSVQMWPRRREQRKYTRLSAQMYCLYGCVPMEPTSISYCDWRARATHSIKTTDRLDLCRASHSSWLESLSSVSFSLSYTSVNGNGDIIVIKSTRFKPTTWRETLTNWEESKMTMDIQLTMKKFIRPLKWSI